MISVGGWIAQAYAQVMPRLVAVFDHAAATHERSAETHDRAAAFFAERGVSQPWHRHTRHDDAAVVEAIVPGHGLSGCGPAVGFPARSSSPMPYGRSSAAGDVGFARTGSRITRAMQPSAVRGETSGPRPTRQSPLAEIEQAIGELGLYSFRKAGVW
jgi:hypothetical protein